MKTRHFCRIAVSLILLIVSAVPLGAPALAEDTSSLTIYLRPSVRFGSDHRTITSFDLLVPFWQTEKDILFFNPRGSLDDRDGSEVNLGFGYRHLLFSDKVILGVNGYYDCRWTGWGTRHEQAGLGAEVMTGWVTGRVNGYFALTGPQLGPMGVSGYFFRDVGIYNGTGSGLEETLGGFDGEIGFKVPYLSDYVETWVYAGGYYFTGDYVDDVNGFSSRVEVVPTDFLRLGFEYRDDNLNGDEYYGEAAVTIPFSVDNLAKGKNPFAGIASHLGGDRTLRERLTEPVRRDVDVRLHVAGSGPGLPGTETFVEDVVFVSENAENIAGTRDGTFEHPYESIGEAMTDGASGVLSGVRTVHVMDDGGAYAGGGTVDIAGLMVWGSGMPHPVYGVITNQHLTAPDIYQLDVTAGGVEVFGGTFVDAYGIVSSGTGTSIHDNAFDGNTGAGIHVTGGSSTVTDNDFLGNARGIYAEGGALTVTGNRFSGGTYGAYITGGTATLSGNTFTGACGIYGTGGSSTITNNDFLGNTFGIYAEGGTFTITGNAIGTAANPVTDTGIYAGGGTTLNPVTGNNIVVSGPGSAYGVRASVENIVLSDNTIDVTSTGGTAYGIYEGPVAGDFFGSVTGGTITASGNVAYGAYLHAYGGSIGSSGSPFTISDAVINANASGGSACGIDMEAANDLYASVTDVTVNADGTGDADGIHLEANIDIYADIDDSAIAVTSGSWGGGYGIYEYSDTGDIFGSITGGSITASGGAARGAVLYADGGSIGDLSDSFTVSGASITANGMHTTSGLRMEALGNLYAAITNNAIVAVSDGFGYGIDERSYTGDIVGSISGGSIAVSAGFAYGAHLYASGSIGSLANPFTITDAVIDATGTLLAPYGIMAYGICLEGDNDLYVSASGATISAGGAADSCGVFLTGVNHSGSIADSTITGTSTDGNWYGIYGYSDGGDIFGSISGGSIAGNGRDAYGVLLDAEGGSIGGSGSPFTISGAAIVANASSERAYGIYMLAAEYLYTSVTDVTVNACGSITASPGFACGVYERASNNIYGSITGGSITASGRLTYGALLSATGPIGDPGNPFTISGVAFYTSGNVIGRGVSGSAANIIANITGNTAIIDGGDYRYFLILEVGISGGNSVDWSGNTYTPVGGPWSGNYDVGGYVTPGPVLANIPDGEITP